MKKVLSGSILSLLILASAIGALPAVRLPPARSSVAAGKTLLASTSYASSPFQVAHSSEPKPERASSSQSIGTGGIIRHYQFSQNLTTTLDVGPLSGPQVPETLALSASQANSSDSFVAFENTTVEPVPNPFDIRLSTVNEPSVANSGSIVFYTGNWYFARSVDGGATWTYGSPADDPYVGMPNFCCDQDVVYDPGRSIFLWYRQGCAESSGVCDNPPASNSVNRFWLGVSGDADDWSFYETSPANVNSAWTSRWFDFPSLAFSNNYLYITTNLFQGEVLQGSLILRWPLDALKNGQSFSYNYYFAPATTLFPTFTFAPVQGAKGKMYWATHLDNGVIRLFSWDESSISITSNDAPIPAFSLTRETGLSSDGRVSFVDKNGSLFWDTGEPVVYDTNNNGFYDPGEPVIAGPAPSSGTVVWSTDPRMAFVDISGNSFWDPGESVVIDSNNNGLYDDCEPVIAGQTPSVGAHCPDPDNGDICSRADDRILGGWVANGVIELFWNVRQGNGYPYPYVDIVTISESSKTLIDSPTLWSSRYAWFYGWVSPNARGDLGLVAFTSGNGHRPALNAGVFDEFSAASPPWEFYTVAESTNGPSSSCALTGDCWGDYVRVRAFDGNGTSWVASGYQLRGCSDYTCIVPRYVVFGRARDNSPAGGAWRSMGPSPIRGCATTGGLCSGRITAIAPDPAHPGTLYLGGAAGGVWKSTDGGSSWTPLTDDQPTQAVGKIAVDATGTVYVGTGDGNGYGYYGGGILKSTNGGASWVQLGASVFGRSTITGLVVDPTHSILIASTGKGLTFTSSAFLRVDPAVQLGVFVSPDSGASWTRTLTATTGVSDLITDPTNPAIVYAALNGTGVYRSENSGTDWARLAGPSGVTGVGRITLAISKALPSTVFAAMEVNRAGQLWKVAMTANPFSFSWSQISLTGTAAQDFCTAGGNSQCFYDMPLAVDPTDPSTLYLGGQDLFRTRNGGSTWTDVGGYVGYIHPDQHVLAFSPSSSSALYVGNDGGIWYSPSANTCSPSLCWSNLNRGLDLSQFQFLAAHPRDPNVYFGGTQDNGTPEHGLFSSTWPLLVAGDGGWTAFDTNDPSIMYHTFYNLNIQRSDDGGASWLDITFGLSSDSSLFYVPMAMDQRTPSTLYLGTYRLYKTTDRGDFWGFPSPGLVLPDPALSARTCSTAECISTIGVAPSNGQYVYVGTTIGRFFASNDGGSNFLERHTGLPGKLMSRIAVDPANPQRILATFSGFEGMHVFLTTNGGVSWADVTSNLPDVPANVGVFGSDGNIYLGTDAGVFLSYDSGGSWSLTGTGLPKSADVDLAFSADRSVLLAATHGRGVWAITLHDVSVDAITASRNFAYSGIVAQPIRLDVVVANQGFAAETFTVTARANGTLIGTQSATLARGASSVLTFTWTIDSLIRGSYLISARASAVSEEANLANNDLTSGTIFTIRMTGDVNNDCVVNIIDLARTGVAFGKSSGQPSFDSEADINNDGIINIIDIATVGTNFGRQC